MGAACPAMAEVNAVRYHTTGAIALREIESALIPAGTISRTNAPQYYANLTVFSVAQIDHRAVLVARSADGAPAAYVVLWGPDQVHAWPSFCRYLTPELEAAQPECDAVPSQ